LSQIPNYRVQEKGTSLLHAEACGWEEKKKETRPWLQKYKCGYSGKLGGTRGEAQLKNLGKNHLAKKSKNGYHRALWYQDGKGMGARKSVYMPLSPPTNSRTMGFRGASLVLGKKKIRGAS